MKATGEETIQHFQDYCKKQSKLFIPDSPRQEAVAKASCLGAWKKLWDSIDSQIEARLQELDNGTAK